MFLMIGSFFSHANKIDSLKTKSEVFGFLVEKFEDKFEYAQLFADKSDSSKDLRWWEYMSDSFYKADIDGNGFTDLVVDGQDCFAVLDVGGKYIVHYFDREHRSGFSFKGFLQLPGRANLLLLTKDSCFYCPDRATQIDTLIYNFDGFVEYNKQVAKMPEIASVSFSTSACFGWCPIYNIEIRSNGDAMYEAKGHNDTLGTMFTTIDAKRIDTFFKLLGYLNTGSLRGAYRVGWTDDQSGTLKIVYANGEVKEISDYGMMGTFGLHRLYEMLKSFRKSEPWKQWYELPSDRNEYMLGFERSFENTMKWSGKNHEPFEWQTYSQRSFKKPGDTMRFTLAHPNVSLSLNPDSSFVFVYKPSPAEERRIYSSEIAFGNWTQQNDSVISLQWNGPLTLNSTRERKIRSRFFRGNKIPKPVRIENWRLQLSKDKKRLMPVRNENEN